MEDAPHKNTKYLVLGLIIVIVVVLLIAPKKKVITEHPASMNVEETDVSVLQNLLPAPLPMEENALILESYSAEDEDNGPTLTALSYETETYIEDVYEDYATYLTDIANPGTEVTQDLIVLDSGLITAIVAADVGNGVFQATFTETEFGTRVDIGYMQIDADSQDIIEE